MVDVRVASAEIAARRGMGESRVARSSSPRRGTEGEAQTRVEAWPRWTSPRAARPRGRGLSPLGFEHVNLVGRDPCALLESVRQETLRRRDPLEPYRGIFASVRDREGARRHQKIRPPRQTRHNRTEPDYQEAKVFLEELDVTGDSLIPEA
jgi:hypothetical protein